MDPLSQLPIDVLLALRDAVADPSEEGRLRAQQRAADAGFYLECSNRREVGVPEALVPSPPRVVAKPITMGPAPDGVVAVELCFDSRSEGESA